MLSKSLCRCQSLPPRSLSFTVVYSARNLNKYYLSILMEVVHLNFLVKAENTRKIRSNSVIYFDCSVTRKRLCVLCLASLCFECFGLMNTAGAVYLSRNQCNGV